MKKSHDHFAISAKFNPERRRFAASQGNKKLNIPVAESISKQLYCTFVELRPLHRNTSNWYLACMKAWIRFLLRGILQTGS